MSKSLTGRQQTAHDHRDFWFRTVTAARDLTGGCPTVGLSQI